MGTIFDALVPVLGMIVAGFLIQRTTFLPPTFWPSAEKLTYYLLFPSLLIHNLANRSMEKLPWLEILLTVEGTVIVSAVIVTIWWRMNRAMSGAVFTSMFQGGVRFNTFAALAVVENLLGADGLFVAAVAAGFMIILINVLCVGAFSLAVPQKGRVTPGRVAIDLLKNPLIIGCLAGVLVNVSGVKLPAAVDGLFSIAGRAAFPIGLMAVGAAYRPENLMLHLHPLLVSSGLQFVIKPVAAFLLARWTGLSGIAASVAVILFSVPTAPSAFILSRQMGGDHESMAAIITAQTVISFVTLPLSVWFVTTIAGS
ncbi:MAG: AEC family transporter [Desulfuromonadia bacterium]